MVTITAPSPRKRACVRSYDGEIRHSLSQSAMTRSEVSVTQNAVPLNNAPAFRALNVNLNAVVQNHINDLINEHTNSKEQLERQLKDAHNIIKEREQTIANITNRHKQIITTLKQRYFLVTQRTNEAWFRKSSEYRRYINENMRVNVELNFEHNKLKKELDVVKTENDVLNNKHDELKQEILMCEAKLNEAKAKRNEAEAKLNEAEAKLNEAKAKRNEAEAKRNEAVEENTKLMKSVQDLSLCRNQALQDLKQNSTDNNERISMQTRHINELEKVVRERDRRIDDLERECSNHERFIAERASIYAKYKADTEQLLTTIMATGASAEQHHREYFR